MRRVLAMVSLLFTFLFVMPSWAEDAPAAAAAVTQAAPAADARPQRRQPLRPLWLRMPRLPRLRLPTRATPPGCWPPPSWCC